MISYFNYEDLSITVRADGSVIFNKDLIYRKMSRSFTIPSWIERDVNDILDNNIFAGVRDVETIRKIVNSKVVELNNTLIPIARANNVKNSELSRYFDFDKYFTPDDITLVAIGHTSIYSEQLTENVHIDVNRVFQKLESKGFQFTKKEKEGLSTLLEERIKELDNNYSLWNIIDRERLEIMHEEITAELAKTVNEYLIELYSPLLMRYMLDNRASNPYFYINTEERKIEYDKDRVIYLLDAMGYDSIGRESELLLYIDRQVKEVSEQLSIVNNEEINDDTSITLTLAVNISILNRLKFVSDNSIPLKEAVNLIYPEVLTSQLELEQIYVDGCANMMNYDEILNDLHDISGVPKYELEGYVKEILEEMSSTFKSMKESNATIDVIYQGMTKTYMHILGIISNKAKRKFSHVKNHPYKSTNPFNMLNWSNNSY